MSSGNITNPLLPTDLQSLTGEGFLARFFPSLVGLTLVIGVIVFFFILLTGAIQWIFSGGDKGAIESARGKISNALIGLVILLSTFAIIQLIEAFFGINILQIDLGPLKISIGAVQSSGRTQPPVYVPPGGQPVPL